MHSEWSKPEMIMTKCTSHVTQLHRTDKAGTELVNYPAIRNCAAAQLQILISENNLLHVR